MQHIVLIEDNPSDVYLMNLALAESGLVFEMTNYPSGADALLALCPPRAPPIRPRSPI